MSNISLYPLVDSDFDEIVTAFLQIGWNKPKPLFQKYLNEEKQGVRRVLVAKDNKQFCGYVTLKWTSDYPSFAAYDIPEIVDLNVLPDFRKIGIGKMLIQACEELAKQHGAIELGLGVGLLADYGSAQRLYVHLGFLPDGQGIHYKTNQVQYGDTVNVDDDLVLYFKKTI